MVAEITSYNVSFKHVPKLKVATALDLPEDAPACDDGIPIQPSKSSKRTKVYEGVPLIVYTDGGVASDVGVAGFVVFAPGGNEEVVRVGKYDIAYTNNQCELYAISEAL